MIKINTAYAETLKLTYWKNYFFNLSDGWKLSKTEIISAYKSNSYVISGKNFFPFKNLNTVSKHKLKMLKK